MKYIKKGAREAFAEGRLNEEAFEASCFTVKSVDKDVVIDTVNGETLITAGNFIMTDSEGNNFGITFSDLENQYEEE